VVTSFAEVPSAPLLGGNEGKCSAIAPILPCAPALAIRRNSWISFEPVEGSLKALADYIGPHKILWATDYPHSDGFFPGAPKMMMDRLEGVSPETKHGVMAGGQWASTG
jgi:hypothetical protein